MRLEPFAGFRDASCGVPTYQLGVLDAIRGMAKAKEVGRESSVAVRPVWAAGLLARCSWEGLACCQGGAGRCWGKAACAAYTMAGHLWSWPAPSRAGLALCCAAAGGVHRVAQGRAL